MDSNLRRRMLDYYNERAPEYEEAYTLGTGTASIGRFLILDSAWSKERARFNTRVERQERRLNDGTTFEVYKRYCDREDISEWANKYDATIRIEHFETAFYAVSGTFEPA